MKMITQRGMLKGNEMERDERETTVREREKNEEEEKERCLRAREKW